MTDQQITMQRYWFQQVEDMRGLAWVASRLMDLIWWFGKGATPAEAIKEIDG